MATHQVPVAPPAPTSRVHYYHADASAYGGSYSSPIAHNIPPQASLSLSPSGGYGSANAGSFQIGNIFSFDSASTEVSGEVSSIDGGWLTKVTATLVGLNVAGVVSADQLVAQIQTEHPLDGDYPTVTFAGTSFTNLTVAGQQVEVTLNLDICDQSDDEAANGYPADPCINDKEFLDKVAQQYAFMNDPDNLPSWVTNRAIPSWITERYTWNPSQNGKRTSVLTTVVQSVTVVPPKNGPFPIRPFLNALELPGIGRVFLGELLVDHRSYNLSMVRLELNGKHGVGINCGPISGANGTTIPPS
ncbi:MAG: choice-of-anchor P family protein [Candidatus Sulfotelmatobacter sp.]|jgi:hypothetical protein